MKPTCHVFRRERNLENADRRDAESIVERPTELYPNPKKTGAGGAMEEERGFRVDVERVWESHICPGASKSCVGGGRKEGRKTERGMRKAVVIATAVGKNKPDKNACQLPEQ